MLALTWKSKKIDVRLHYTKGTVTIEVGDIYLDGTTKNRGLLDWRSAGFKWHFSFFVNFRAGIQQSAFKDAILLLDVVGVAAEGEEVGGGLDGGEAAARDIDGAGVGEALDGGAHGGFELIDFGRIFVARIYGLFIADERE
jgi:hypothetical protein